MLQMSAVYRLLAAASPNMDIASATGTSPHVSQALPHAEHTERCSGLLS